MDEGEEQSWGQHSTLSYALPDGPLFAQLYHQIINVVVAATVVNGFVIACVFCDSCGGGLVNVDIVNIVIDTIVTIMVNIVNFNLYWFGGGGGGFVIFTIVVGGAVVVVVVAAASFMIIIIVVSSSPAWPVKMPYLSEETVAVGGRA